MLAKRKYNIGEQVKIQTVDDTGIVYYDCEVIDSKRVQMYVNGGLETEYKLRTINNKIELYFIRTEKELDLKNPRKEL